MCNVVTFGEIMLRLCPKGYRRILQADEFEATYAGAEANVAAALSRWGLGTKFVSKVPENPLGQAAVDALRKCGIGTENVLRGGERLGIYFAERGLGLRSGQVIYDRAHSALAQAKKEEFDWKHILKGAQWLHLTGITPALGGQTAAICEEACMEAKRQNIRVSIDVNFRRKLWTQQQAGKTLSRLLPMAEVVFVGSAEMQSLFGISCSESASREDSFFEGARQICRMFGIETVATTLREGKEAQRNTLKGLLFQEGQNCQSRTYDVAIADRLGGGDAFAAGLIYALLQKMSSECAIEFATAASCLKHTCEGDFNQMSVQEVAALAQGGDGGCVLR